MTPNHMTLPIACCPKHSVTVVALEGSYLEVHQVYVSL